MTDNSGYSIKDFLAIHTKALERIERKVDEGALKHAEAIGKLDTRVSVLEQRQDLEPRVRVLENSRSETVGEKTYRRWLWPAVGAVCGGLWWLPGHIH